MLDDSSIMFPETAHFSGRVVHNITFNDSVNFNNIDNALEQPIYLDVETKQRLKNAININRKTYEFNMKSSHNALLATKDYPHIVIMNLKRKD